MKGTSITNNDDPENGVLFVVRVRRDCIWACRAPRIAAAE
jgi:hypothetical protein